MYSYYSSLSVFVNRFKSLSLVLVSLLLLASSCTDDVDTSQEAVIPDGTARVVEMTSAGLLSPKDEIIVKFTDTFITPDLVKKDLVKTVFEFTPKMDGRAYWKDRQTLAFKPNAIMPLRQKYKVKLLLNELFPLGKNLEPLPFTFDVSGMEITGFEGDFETAEPNKPDPLVFKGTIIFMLPVDSTTLAKALKTSINGTDLKVKLIAANGGQSYQFITQSFKRPKKEKKLKIYIPKKALDLSANFEIIETLPPLKALKVSKITGEKTDKEPAISIRFSDELDRQQDIRGLIEITGLPDIKLGVSGKMVDITGNFEYGKSYDVSIHPGIRSKWGAKIEREYGKKISFTFINPKMQFAKSGIFLPTSEDAKLILQTVNLKRVQLKVKRVYASNLGHFMHESNLNSSPTNRAGPNSWTFRRVGTTLLTDTLEIGDKKNEWLNHAIDMTRLIPKQEKGLFLLEINFQRHDMNYPELEETKGRNWSYWGDNYYTDPRAPGYMWENSELVKPLIISDLGLTYIKGHKEHLVYATNLNDATPLSGVTVRLRSFQNQVLAEKITAGDGKAKFENIGEEVFYVEGEKWGQRSIIKLNEMKWNQSGFDVGGATVKDPDKYRAFIYTERGVHRPGDTVFVNIIARDNNDTFPDDLPMTVKILNPKQRITMNRVYRKSREGFYHFNFTTSQNDPTGNWKAEITIGTQKFIHPIRIETIVPDRIKLELIPKKDRLFSRDHYLNIKMVAKYLFGNPASGLEAKVKININPRKITFPAFANFIFNNSTVKASPLRFNVFDGNISMDGITDISWKIPSFRKFPSAVNAEIEGRVIEKGGRAVVRKTTIPIETHFHYAGLEMPDLEWGTSAVDQPVHFRYILVGVNGTPKSGKQLYYKIYKNTTHWWWEYRSRSKFELRFKSDSNTELLEEGVLVSQNKAGKFTFTPTERGEYLVEIGMQGEESNIASAFFSASYWGDAPAGDDAGLLVLNSDKNKYQPGEKATIHFPTPAKGNILFNLIKGGKILQSRWIKPDKKETSIEFKISKEMMPNVYAAVSVIQPYAQTENDRPMRMYGITNLFVEDKQTRQELEIITDPVIRSNSSFKVKIQTKDRKPTQLTLAVVDEGLLTITGFNTPDAWQHFYQKQRLSVEFYDLFSQIIGINKGDIFKVFSIGGDIALAELYRQDQVDKEEAKRFKPVVIFKGPFKTDARGQAEISMQMPNYMGAVKIMAVSAVGGRYGSEEKTVPVKDQLMVMPTLPRVLGPGETFQVPVGVFTTEDNVGDVKVSIKTAGPVIIKGQGDAHIKFTKADNKDVLFKLKAKNEIGIATIIITAKSKTYSTEKKIELNVRPATPRLFRKTSVSIGQGEDLTIETPGKGIKGTNKLSLQLSRLPKLDLSSRLGWLMRYPYGCIEQTVSSVFPQLYLADFIEGSEVEEERIDTHINAAINRLRGFALPGGGLSYWPGNTRISDWGSLYGAHFLAEAKIKGYHVPDDIYYNLFRFLETRAIAAQGTYLERSYRLFILALAGKPIIGPMNLLKENSLSEMVDTEKWLLATAYKLAGVDRAAKTISEKAGTNTRPFSRWSRSYGSPIRDQAIILMGMTIFEDWAKAWPLYKNLSTAISENNWYSTQTASFSLLALGKFIQAKMRDFGDGVIKGKFIIDDKKPVNFEFKDIKKSFTLANAEAEKIRIEIDPDSKPDSVFATLDWSGIPLLPDQKKIEKNLWIKTKYYNDDGMQINERTIKQGQVFWAHIQFGKTNTVNFDLKEMALVQIIPSGWEIENTRLSGESIPAWFTAGKIYGTDYFDLRDDRAMWFFDIPKRTKGGSFLLKLNAVTVGEFHLAPTVLEAMYNANYQATRPGGKVKVVNR